MDFRWLLSLVRKTWMSWNNTDGDILIWLLPQSCAETDFIFCIRDFQLFFKTSARKPVPLFRLISQNCFSRRRRRRMAAYLKNQVHSFPLLKGYLCISCLMLKTESSTQSLLETKAWNALSHGKVFKSIAQAPTPSGPALLFAIESETLPGFRLFWLVFFFFCYSIPSIRLLQQRLTAWCSAESWEEELWFQ